MKTQQECKHKLKCVHCQKVFTSANQQENSILNHLMRRPQIVENTTIIAYIRESQKKGFFRKLLNWIW